MNLNHKHSLCACCIGYVTQAIVNSFMPLLFATFKTAHGISLDKIGLLITINFVIQMAADCSAAKYTDKIGYRGLIIFAHFSAAAGLVLLGLAPIISPDNIYPMLVAATVIYAVGGGLIEVLVSPMVEALPISNKAGTMSLLHSFYCWGVLAVTLLSTLFFAVGGIKNWHFLSLGWAIIPLLNALAFFKVPIYKLNEKSENMNMRHLFSEKLFWLLLILMICAGASELAMSQWASYFAEIGLGVSKTVGDLLGPCLFAAFMGASRVLYSRISAKFSLAKALTASSIMCVACYLLATLSPFPMLSIAGCALTGFSVGIMWPGVYSLSAKKFPRGGTAMFALLALGGDVGCTSGPSIVGWISDALGGSNTSIKTALLTTIVFPIVMLVTMRILAKISPQNN